MQYHKRKRLQEEQSLDIKPSKLGVKVEGSERERAKRIVRRELKDYEGGKQNNRKLERKRG